MNKTIAILAGDGIGPEVMQAALKILDYIALRFNHHFTYFPAKIGGAAYDKFNTHCPNATIEICQKADAILFGSVGGPVQEQHQAKWKNCEVNSILKLRKHFDFNINIRPIKIYPEIFNICPLKAELIKEGIDIVIFRELTGGIYFGKHENINQFAIDDCTYTDIQIHSIAHAAFKTAQLRQNKVCSVDKANVLATSKLWREVVTDVSKEYPNVALTHMLVDNCAMQIITQPQQFDVIVTENMFGDILSDLAAALCGSLGLVPSASLNGNNKGLYEPAGGSAPDIAGKNIANPCAQILSAAMMLRYSFGMLQEADLIEAAIKDVITRQIVTPDLARDKSTTVSTTEMVNAIQTYMSGLFN